MVLASNSYWYCRCKFNSEKIDPAEIFMLYFSHCKIQDKYFEDELERIKYALVK